MNNSNISKVKSLLEYSMIYILLKGILLPNFYLLFSKSTSDIIAVYFNI